jgi:hypothetical protein
MGTRRLSTPRCALGRAARVGSFFFLLLLLLLIVPSLCSCQDLNNSELTGAVTSGASLQQEGEILLEAAGTLGPDPFIDDPSASAGLPSALNITATIPTPGEATLAHEAALHARTAAALMVVPTLAPIPTVPPPVEVTTEGTQQVPVTAGGAVQAPVYSGGTPALYGGSKDKSLADKERQLDFFKQNPDKAAAFCAALNSDPTFSWSGGDQIQPSQLRDYFAEFTPLMLTHDTGVTNHGYRDGAPTPRQSVLQAGQMVLVDRNGVPRVRCECGNPMIPPQPAQKTPTYAGSKWPRFDPDNVVVVQGTPEPIARFIVADIDTGKTFERLPGTDGTQDNVTQDTGTHDTGTHDTGVEATAWQLTVQLHFEQLYVTWDVVFGSEVTLNADGTLTGSTSDVTNLEGAIQAEDGAQATFWANLDYAVDITGTAETTAGGKVLHITATTTVDNIADWGVSNEDALGEEYAGWYEILIDYLPGYADGPEDSFTMDIPADSTTPVTVTGPEGYTGTATLMRLR